MKSKRPRLNGAERDEASNEGKEVEAAEIEDANGAVEGEEKSKELQNRRCR